MINGQSNKCRGTRVFDLFESCRDYRYVRFSPRTIIRSIRPPIVGSVHRQSNKRTFALLDRDRARRDDESHRLVQHQEYWDAGTNRPGKAFTPLQERTPYLDTLAASATAGLPRKLPGHSSILFCRRTGSNRAKTKEPRDESSDIPKIFQGWPEWLTGPSRKRMLVRAGICVDNYDRLFTLSWYANYMWRLHTFTIFLL